MKKHDIVLILAILAIAGIWFGIQRFTGTGTDEAVIVTIDGVEYGTYDLMEDQTISIQDSNTLVIENGTANMTEADCPDRLCVHQKAISRDGESIICLPNKVVATIRSHTPGEFDAIAN